MALSLKRKKFCKLYKALGETPTAGREAATQAGFKQITADILLLEPEVQEFLKKDVPPVTMDVIIEYWTKVLRDKEATTTERMKAADSLIKHGNLDSGTKQAGDLTDKELQQELFKEFEVFLKRR